MLTLITITYNNFDELKATLDSAAGVKVEHIVINGGTCLETKELLSRFKGKTISEPDRGIADAFNKGLGLATGKGVMFLNSGDKLIHPDYLRTAEILLDRFDFVHSDIVFDDSIVGPIRMKPARCSLGRGMPYFHQSMVVRRDFMQKVGGFDTNFRIAMDYDYVIRMHMLGAKGAYYDQNPTILMDGKGVSATQETKSLVESLAALKKNHALTLRNRLEFFIRYLNFRIRSQLMKMGLERVVGFIKRSKHG